MQAFRAFHFSSHAIFLQNVTNWTVFDFKENYLKKKMFGWNLQQYCQSSFVVVKSFTALLMLSYIITQKKQLKPTSYFMM